MRLISAIRRGEAMRHIVDQAVNAVSRLFEAIVLHKGERNELGRPRERYAVLLDIGGVLGRIELDDHSFCIYEPAASGKVFVYTRRTPSAGAGFALRHDPSAERDRALLLVGGGALRSCLATSELGR